jgi:hypothetical protein
MSAIDRKAGSNRGTPGKPADGAAIPPRRTWLAFFLLLAFNYFLVSLFFPAAQGPEPIS